MRCRPRDLLFGIHHGSIDYTALSQLIFTLYTTLDQRLFNDSSEIDENKAQSHVAAQTNKSSKLEILECIRQILKCDLNITKSIINIFQDYCFNSVYLSGYYFLKFLSWKT